MDFNKFVGKTVIWTGTFESEDGEMKDKYLLFNDRTVAHFPDVGTAEEPVMLEDGPDVLKQLFDKHAEFAKNVIALGPLLEPAAPMPTGMPPAVITAPATIVIPVPKHGDITS